MQFTEEQKKALAGLCNIEIKRWKAASEANPNMRYMVELMEIALAALTQKACGWLVGLPGLYPTFTLDYRNVESALEAGGYEITPVYTTPPVAALTAQPVKLPQSFSPELSVFGADARCVMRADKKGRWVNRAAVELAIRAAGYEFTTAPAEEKK